MNFRSLEHEKTRLDQNMGFFVYPICITNRVLREYAINMIKKKNEQKILILNILKSVVGSWRDFNLYACEFCYGHVGKLPNYNSY